MAISLSVVMPAHKEAGNLEGAARYVTDNMEILTQEGKISDWEIIIVDSLERDGSSDGTPRLANRLAEQDSAHVRAIHNHGYVNLGLKYRQGLAAARFDYFMMVPGKNTLHSDSLKNLLGNVPKDGIVIGYQADMSRRPFKRRLISKSFITFMNVVFGIHLKYYNGTTVIPTRLLRKLNLQAEDFAYMAEALVILLKKYRVPYVEAPFYTRGRRVYGKTRATDWSNVKSVAITILRLMKRVYFSEETHLGG